MANWTARLNSQTAQTDNSQTAREFVNWATLILQQMSNREFEANRKAIHEIDAIKAQILAGTLTQHGAIQAFKHSIGR